MAQEALGNVAARGLGFLCPRSPVPWLGCLLSRVAACQLPSLLSGVHAWLRLSTQHKGPVSGPAASLEPAHLPPSAPSELALPTCGQQAPGRRLWPWP